MFTPIKPNPENLRSKPSLDIAPSAFDKFKTRIKQEFLQGSAIHPDLFTANVRLVTDTEQLPGGEVNYPIHEALNWHITRFGLRARTTLHGALLQNADGSTWQAKLSDPILDPKKGQLRKYETPAGNGSRAYLPQVPDSIRRMIAQRYGITVPLEGDFWSWLVGQPQIPIICTEGGKKALSLLSLGYVAIALYGVNGGYRAKDALGERCDPYLIPDLERFTSAGRQVVLAFDQDEQLRTNLKVNHALSRFGGLLSAQGVAVSVALWEPKDGKGCDDLIVNSGAQAFHTAYQEALSMEHWQIHQRLIKRLTYAPARVVETSDLTTLDWSTLPQEGIVGLASAKGSAKTKTIGLLIEPEPVVALSTFRICLGRNLCKRIGIHWRGDLDKVDGKFITGEGYTLRVGFCVDSLLAIDPEQFRGCVLVIDEAVQVFRHLLTSSTCAKDGKLRALLERLRELVRAARRVIAADADLDDATLNYLTDLRGDGKPVYLVRNDYKPQGYPVDFIQAPDPSPAIACLLKAVNAGSKIFVTTDSKAASKQISVKIQRMGVKVLLINSNTSGGELEQQFITNPDAFLAAHDYQVVVATPSLSTGVSIESGYFDQVYGLFYGVSSTDADMAQGLGRVRPSAPRVVWCAQTGLNFSSVSRSTNSLQLKAELKTRTDWTTALLRSALEEDVIRALDTYDWQADSHMNLWAKISADCNFSMLHLRSALLVRLRCEGNRVAVLTLESDAAIKAQMKEAKEEIKRLEAQAISGAEVLTKAQQLLLETNESINPQDQLNLEKTYLADFYCLSNEEVTPDWVLADKEGRRRAELLSLESQLYPDVAQERDIRGLERQVAWGKGLCAWDIGTAAIRRHARQQLGLEQFFAPNLEWTKYDLAEAAKKVRENREQVKLVLNFTASDAVADTQIVHQLLRQMGLGVTSRWSRSVPGHEGEKLKVYRLDSEVWADAIEILGRRAARRTSAKVSASTGSPSSLNELDEREGDPELTAWVVSDKLRDVEALVAEINSPI